MLRAHAASDYIENLKNRSIAIGTSIALAMAHAGLPASAQFGLSEIAADDGGRVSRQFEVRLDHLRRIHVTSRGRVIEDTGGGVANRGCRTARTYADQSFEGGTYNGQGGFSEGEWAASSFTIPASDFPVKIDSIEMIFVTQNAIVSTTTQWSVGVWAGTPASGTLQDLFSSDDVILPHLQMPTGTNGTDLLFTVDPNDPNQIVVNDNGSHVISVGYRVDVHNDQTQDPCTVAPPARRNAFPATDTAGLSQPTNNWLFGLNCGPFGCPANGGWARFSALPSFCRPSGDWMIRVTYTPLDCQPGVGACCINGACSIQLASQCEAQGGTYQGDGSSCSGVNCPQPLQACCFAATQGCLNLTEANCLAAGGIPGGLGTACATFVCFPMGACCLPSGSCVGPVSPQDCQAQGGVFQGNGTSCANVDCPDPIGACCFGTGFCLVLSAADCAAAGATWHGAGSTCDDGNSNGTADVCEAPPDCPGDVDGDLDVDLTDLSHLLTNFGTPTGMAREDGDLDGDEDVDLTDLSALLSNFGSAC